MTDRELDAAIEEQIFGNGVYRDKQIGPVTNLRPSPTGPINEFMGTPVRCYTKDIRAAWEVVEKMRSDGYFFRVDFTLRSLGWFASFWYDNAEGSRVGTCDDKESAPRAICLAALRAKSSGVMG